MKVRIIMYFPSARRSIRLNIAVEIPVFHGSCLPGSRAAPKREKSVSCKMNFLSQPLKLSDLKEKSCRPRSNIYVTIDSVISTLGFLFYMYTACNMYI